MRIRFRIQHFTLLRIRMLIRIRIFMDPVPDPGYKNDVDPDADPDPQHWFLAYRINVSCVLYR